VQGVFPLGLIAYQDRVVCCVLEYQTVNVVDVSVLLVAKVQVVLQHSRLRTVKDGRLIHVIPESVW
jgi:hypothetical protein